MRKGRIFIGVFRCSSNSFTPLWADPEQFTIANGDEMMGYTPASETFEAEGFEVIPSIAAMAPAGGLLRFTFFQKVVQEMLDALPIDGSIQGVFLHLQGAQNVEFIGSGEAYLVSRIRDILGSRVPIAVTLDYHANLTCSLTQAANLLVGYRTNPHTDVEDTARHTAHLLVKAIRENMLPVVLNVRLPILIPDSALTRVGMGEKINMYLRQIEEDAEVQSASFFAGSPWEDIPNAGASLIVCTTATRSALLEKMKNYASMIWNGRRDFVFESDRCTPMVAIARAQTQESGITFITDTGDNVTNGAVGDNAYMLKCILENGAHHVLIAAIYDEPAVTACAEAGKGKMISIEIGGKYDPKSTNVFVTGMVKHLRRDKQGIITGCVFSIDGNIDVLLSKQRRGIVKLEEIEAYNVYLGGYRIIIIKQGYLLECFMQYAADVVMALSPGNTTLDFSQLPYRKISRPIDPLDPIAHYEPYIENIEGSMEK